MYSRKELARTSSEVLSSIPPVVALEALLAVHSVMFRASPAFKGVRVRVMFSDNEATIQFPYTATLDPVTVKIDGLYLITLIRIKDLFWSVTSHQKRLYELISSRDWRMTAMKMFRSLESYPSKVDFYVETSPATPFSIRGKSVEFDSRIRVRDAWHVYLFNVRYRDYVLRKWKEFL